MKLNYSKLKYLIVAFILISLTQSSFAQSIVGRWKTIDDNSGKTRSIVEIYKKDDKYFGKIVKLYREPGEPQDPLCEECKGDKKNQKVLGMEIITNLEYDPEEEEYTDGEILDPENGNIYDCKIWMDERGELKVRGYLYFFYRTQTWLPAES